MASPASQPGARPPAGGVVPAMSCPLTASSQAMSELEFHISPVPSSSSPQVAVGNTGTASRSRRAWSWSALSSRGLSTA